MAQFEVGQLAAPGASGDAGEVARPRQADTSI
jgi:hypothetical protein